MEITRWKKQNGFQELQEDQEDALPSIGFEIFLRRFVKVTDENYEERRYGFQELEEDQEDSVPSLGFVIFLQNFVKGTDGNFKDKSRNGFQEFQGCAPKSWVCDIFSTLLSRESMEITSSNKEMASKNLKRIKKILSHVLDL